MYDPTHPDAMPVETAATLAALGDMWAAQGGAYCPRGTIYVRPEYRQPAWVCSCEGDPRDSDDIGYEKTWTDLIVAIREHLGRDSLYYYHPAPCCGEYFKDAQGAILITGHSSDADLAEAASRLQALAKGNGRRYHRLEASLATLRDDLLAWHDEWHEDPANDPSTFTWAAYDDCGRRRRIEEEARVLANWENSHA